MGMTRCLLVLCLGLCLAFTGGIAEASPGRLVKKITGKLTVQNNYRFGVSVYIEGKIKGIVPARSTLSIPVMENSSKTSIKIIANDGQTWEKRIGDEHNPNITVP
jgi:hypothetical protein